MDKSSRFIDFKPKTEADFNISRRYTSIGANLKSLLDTKPTVNLRSVKSDDRKQAKVKTAVESKNTLDIVKPKKSSYFSKSYILLFIFLSIVIATIAVSSGLLMTKKITFSNVNEQPEVKKISLSNKQTTAPSVLPAKPMTQNTPASGTTIAKTSSSSSKVLTTTNHINSQSPTVPASISAASQNSASQTSSGSTTSGSTTGSLTNSGSSTSCTTTACGGSNSSTTGSTTSGSTTNNP